MSIIFGLMLAIGLGGTAGAQTPEVAAPCADELGVPIGQTFRAEVRRIKVPGEKNAGHAVILSARPLHGRQECDVIFKGVSINSLVRAKTMCLDIDYRGIRRECIFKSEFRPGTLQGWIDVIVSKMAISRVQVKNLDSLREGAMLKINGGYYRLLSKPGSRHGQGFTLAAFSGKPKVGDTATGTNTLIVGGNSTLSLGGEPIDMIIYLGPSTAVDDQPRTLATWPNAGEDARTPLDRFKLEVENFSWIAPEGTP